MSPLAQQAPNLRANDSVAEVDTVEGVTMVEVRNGLRLALVSSDSPKEGDRALPDAERIRGSFSEAQIEAFLRRLSRSPTLLLMPDRGDPQSNFAALIGRINQGRNSVRRASVNAFFGPTDPYTFQNCPIIGWQPILIDGRPHTDCGKTGWVNPWDKSGLSLPERLKRWHDFLEENPLLGGMDRLSYAAFMLDGLEREAPPDADSLHCTILDKDPIIESGQHIPIGYYDNDRPFFRWKAPRDVPGSAQFRLSVRGTVCR